jgi:uncharacterized YigZ family protein
MAFFRTISKIGEGLYKEKGSKFYGFAIPCSSEDEAKVHLNKLRKEHHLAVHVCYAFRFGSDKKIYRSSDDGEPSNSAGPPILGQIQSFDLTNILVVVVRYYGGTNLGVGGLINAYRTAAKVAVENSVIIEDEEKQQIRISFSYEHIPKVMQIIKSYNLNILEQNFENNCFIRLIISSSNKSALEQFISIENLKIYSDKQ